MVPARAGGRTRTLSPDASRRLARLAEDQNVCWPWGDLHSLSWLLPRIAGQLEHDAVGRNHPTVELRAGIKSLEPDSGFR